MADEQKREVTEEVRRQLRMVAERMVDNSGVDESRRKEALEATISRFEKWYKEGHDIMPPKGKNVGTLEWKDGKWELKADWLGKWESGERFLLRRK